MENEYVYERDFVVDTDDLSQMKVANNPMGSPRREDKSVIDHYPDGHDKQSGSIMLGHNKRGIQLKDGSFISEDELEEAIKRELSHLGPNRKVVSRKTGEQLDMAIVQQMVKEAIIAAGKISVEGRENLSKTDLVRRTVTGAHNGPQASAPSLVSKMGAQLPNGDYVSAEEIQKALKEYIVVALEEKVVDDPVKTKEPVMIRVVKKYKAKLKPIVIVGICALLAAAPFVRSVKTNTVISEPTISITQYDASYKLQVNDESFIIENDQLGIIMGETQAHFGEDMKAAEYGNQTGMKKGVAEFALEGKQSGDYTISGFAIICNGKVISYYENFGKYPNTNLSEIKNDLNEFIDQTMKEHPEISINDIDVQVHLGSDSSKDRLGWISVNDIIQNDRVRISGSSVVKSYEGSVKGNTTEFVSFQGPNGLVTIKITDDNGQFLRVSDVVKGSDGVDYIISSLDITNVKSENGLTEETTKEVNINLLPIAMAMAVTAGAYAASALKAKRMTKQAEKNPSYMDFATEEEYQKFKKEFEEKEAEWEKESKFWRLFIKKQEFIQRFTTDQLHQIYDIVTSNYGESVRVSTNDGKIIVVYPDGTQKEVTQEVMAQINEIGKDNQYEAHTK